MKTIEEASKDNALFKEGCLYEAKAIKHFKAGVEFAQRWIPIEEELPKVDKDDIWNHAHKFSKVVLTKNDELNFPNYRLQAYNEEVKEWQTTYKVTHWRPIKYK